METVERKDVAAAAHEVAKRQHHKLRGESHDTAAARARRDQGARVQLALDEQTKLLGGADPPTIQYDFSAVEGWCDRVLGGIGCLDEIFIPVNPDGNR